MKLFLTGGTGFFGKALLRHWTALQQARQQVPDVCVLSRNPQHFLNLHPEFLKLPWLRFVSGDVQSPESLPMGEKFTHVLHGAADSTRGPQLTPLAQYDQIVEGTRNMLDFAIQAGVQRFLFTSSGAAYGKQPAHLSHVSEDWHGMPDPLNPTHSYGVAKRAAEHLCALYGQAYGLQTVVARCFAFSGPDLPLNAHFAIGNFIRDALFHNEITVAGDGTAMRSYLDQSDLAQWLTALLDRAQSGEAFNVGSDQAISIADLAALVRDTLAPDMSIRILGTPDAQRPRHMYIPNTDKINRHLGLRAGTTLKDSILNTAHAARSRANCGA